MFFLFDEKRTIFNFLNNMNDNYSVFGLTAEQSEVLFAFQRTMTSFDVSAEGKKDRIWKKQLWLDTWDKSIDVFLKTFGGYFE